jgi:hypothetical protein
MVRIAATRPRCQAIYSKEGMAGFVLAGQQLRRLPPVGPETCATHDRVSTHSALDIDRPSHGGSNLGAFLLSNTCNPKQDRQLEPPAGQIRHGVARREIWVKHSPVRSVKCLPRRQGLRCPRAGNSPTTSYRRSASIMLLPDLSSREYNSQLESGDTDNSVVTFSGRRSPRKRILRTCLVARS